jgi:hypothetical protein
VSLREALDNVETYLTRLASLDLETTLRARWIAAGQSAEAFPGREDWKLDDREPWELARLVLSLVGGGGSVPPERWREIAEAVTISALGHELYKIGKYHEGGRVNDLAHAGSAVWKAQFAYVPPLPSDSIERFDWSLGDYSIGLNLISHRAYFTDIGAKWNRVPRANALPSARDRLPTLDTSDVRGAGVITTEESITQVLRPTSTMSFAQRLEHLLGEEEQSSFRAPRLESLELRVPGTAASAHVDFHRMVVRTSEAVPLRTYALLCARYVAGLGSDEIQELEDLLAPRPN